MQIYVVFRFIDFLFYRLDWCRRYDCDTRFQGAFFFFEALVIGEAHRRQVRIASFRTPPSQELMFDFLSTAKSDWVCPVGWQTCTIAANHKLFKTPAFSPSHIRGLTPVLIDKSLQVSQPDLITSDCYVAKCTFGLHTATRHPSRQACRLR